MTLSLTPRATGAARPRSIRRWMRLGIVIGLAMATITMVASPAAAHPLGNFSVNHYDGLTLRPDGIGLLAVVDTAEIPTSQELDGIDRNGDGRLSDSELERAADRQCPRMVESLTTTVDGDAVEWVLAEAALRARPGAADLPTLRLTCRFDAEVAIEGTTTVRFVDEYRSDRVGWREITAVGEGVRLIDPPVPSTSISNQLRDYPDDLLSTPRDVSEVTLVARPGTALPQPDEDEMTAAGDPFTHLVAAGERLLESTIGQDELTLLLGALAVLLALLLGAGHAVLPGHGKTVMAAYLAGRRGTRTDALIVGATVTITHTAGVLVLGLLVSLGSAVAGEVILERLSLLSGVVIAVIGAMLVRDAVRARHRVDEGSGPHHRHTHPGSVEAAGAHHTHAHGGPEAHVHDDAHAHHHPHAHDPRFSRRGLVGMGMAGGLVPSPSALVVLLGSVALGRTLFGVSLVLVYGLGMAMTLVTVGLMLVHFRNRLDGARPSGALGSMLHGLARWVPVATAGLVLLVGVGLTVRSLVLTA